MTPRRHCSGVALLPVLVLACTTFDTTPVVDGGVSDASAADVEVRVDGGGPTDAAVDATREPFVCGSAWLCDDFEASAFPNPLWNWNADFVGPGGGVALLKEATAPSPSNVLFSKAAGGERGRLSARHTSGKALRCALDLKGLERGDSEAILLQMGVQGAIAQYQVAFTVTTGDAVRVQAGGKGLDGGVFPDTAATVPLSSLGSWHHVDVEVGMGTAAQVRVAIDRSVVLSGPINGLDPLRALGDSGQQFIYVGAAPSGTSASVWKVAYDDVRCEDL
ncbi:MAG: hypothetical protein HOO96_19635 [Polyangiaceae bacterium]|nr:hypothetical protein [Polyangiaceae bacterium]